MTLDFDGTFQYKRKVLWFTIGRAKEYRLFGSLPVRLSSAVSESSGPLTLFAKLSIAGTVDVWLELNGIEIIRKEIELNKHARIRVPSIKLDVDVALVP